MSDQNHPCICGHPYTDHESTPTGKRCTVWNVEYDERWWCTCPDYIASNIDQIAACLGLVEEVTENEEVKHE